MPSNSDPTATPTDIFRIIPCEGWVYRERLDPLRELERYPDGSERVVHSFQITVEPRRTD